MLAVGTFAAPAEAFYWYGWPGGPRPPKTVVPPDKPGNPPENPPPENPPPENPPPPNGVPEPGTAVAALVGLGALAVSRAWRRKSQVIVTPTSTS